MAFIRSAIAIAAARSYLCSSPISFSSCSSVFRDNARSIRPFASLSTRFFSVGVNNESDTDELRDWCARKKNIAPDCKYLGYRKGRGLFVTDLTDTERRNKRKELTPQGRSNKSTTESAKTGADCDEEKEKENVERIKTNGRSVANNCIIKLAKFINGDRLLLFNGLTCQLLVEKMYSTKAMKAGAARHRELAKEVVRIIEGKCKSEEDKWAKKLVDMIISLNQLLLNGLTREHWVFGFVCGVWIIGRIDEIILSEGEKPQLIDTKTRVKNTLPSDTKTIMKGRLQLMIYKLLWDKLVSEEFPLEQFCASYQLDPDKPLSEEIRTRIADAGVPAKTLGEVVRYMEKRCKMLRRADNKMILRFEWQKNNSVIKEDEFEFDPVLLMTGMERNMGFWLDGESSKC